MELAHIEKEYKVMIDDKTYESLVHNLKLIPFKQINYYYDTYRKDCAMRIREKDGKYLFTLKQKGNGFKYEYEFEIPSNDLNNAKVQEVLDQFNISNYKYLGTMTTYRCTVEMNYGELCVDKSIYNGIVDYELEYELYNHEIDKYDDFLDLLKNYNVEFKTSKYTKFRRFLNSMEK